MRTNQKKTKIGDFLKRIKRPIDLIDDKEYKLVTIKLHHNGVTLRETKKGSEIKSKMYEVKAGDFILSGIDARNGAFGIVPEELDGAIVTNDFWYFDIDEKIIDKHFFLELTATEWFDDICKKGSDGTTQTIRLQKDKFFNQTINLPTRYEQDKLLTVFKSRKKLTEKLSARITNNLELIPLLRQQILQDAITGKLSEKWRKENPNIESAEVLLEKIKAEKEKLVKEGKLKKQKQLSPITDNEKPFQLPEGWVWCRLGEIIQVTSGDFLPSHMMIENGGIPVFGGNGITGYHNSFNVSRETIVIGRVGAYCGSIHLTPLKAWVTDNAFKLIYLETFFDKVWLMYLLRHLNLRKHSFDGAQPVISGKRIYPIVIPLPPLAEQQYIVERIESLFAKLERIKELNLENQKNIDLLNQVVLKEMVEE